MLAFLLIEVFDCVAQHRARHAGRMLVEKSYQSGPIFLSCFANPAPGRFMNQIVFVLYQQLSDSEGVINLALPQKTLP